MPPSSEDSQHLKWLSIGHYVYAVMMAGWSLFGAFFIAMGMTLGNLPQGARNPPPPMFGFVFAAFGAMFMLGFLALAVATGFAGRNLARRKNHVFCLVIAGLDCTWFPIGTTLGALSFAVLLRPSVKALFEDTPPSPAVEGM